MSILIPDGLGGDRLVRVAALALVSILMAACEAPSNEQIFVNPPANTQFETDTGTVLLSQLSGKTVCYTTDGSAADYAGGDCSGGSTQTYNSGIELACDSSESGAEVLRQVSLAFEWDASPLGGITLETRSALFFLNCDNGGQGNDSDGDGIVDLNDNCPADYNPEQIDSDDDGDGDVCDVDQDNDGIDDDADNCPAVANTDQADGDGDQIGDVCDADLDNDGVNNDQDNCPVAPNAGQSDGDGDGIGDACDLLFDTDGDGVEDDLDNCPLVPNADQADTDGDDIGDACDEPGYVGTDKFFYDYLDLLDRLMEIMQCTYNNCNQPDGTFNWSINASNSELEAGSANWKATVNSFFPPTALMTFTANNAMLDSCLGNGSASGVLNSSATGPLNTGASIEFQCDGLTGYIQMHLNLTGGSITGGYYDAFCLEASCDDFAVRYRITGTDSNGDLIYSREVLGTTLP
ncbi:MAG: hypothetical protein GY938_09375 [Ketobacter sp.]|nr:hypothetical protein [Ketobacter sp.]